MAVTGSPELLIVMGAAATAEQVDDAEERLALLLRGGVLAEAPAVVAEGLRAGGSDTAEDAHLTSQYRNYA